MSDVVIVGAGPAGCALAILLGRAGHAVTLVERARFPRDKACGEGLMPAGVAVLVRLGLKELVASGAPFWGVRYHAEETTAWGRFVPEGAAPAFGLGARRLHLDARLAAAARATPGVTLLEGLRVEGPLVEAGRVIGVRAGGARFLAPLTVAADGLRSPLREALGLGGGGGPSRMGLRAHYRLAGGRPAPPWVDVFLGGPGREVYVTPLPDGELLVAVLGPRGGLVPADFERLVREPAALASRLAGAERVSPVIGMAPLWASARRGAPPGIVLLGDAAGFIDPVTGGGMAQALMSAELLAGFVPRLLAPGGDAAFAEFARARGRLLRDYRLFTRGVLLLAGHPRLAAGAVAVLARHGRLFDHALGVAGGLGRLTGRRRGG